MKRFSLALCALVGLAACGGGSQYSSASRGYAPPVVMFATGPIQKACQAQGRKAATRGRCGCVQAVANQSLSAGDQRRGASYFKDPHKLQEVRQSSNPGNERFWRDWKAYGERAEQLCSGT